MIVLAGLTEFALLPKGLCQAILRLGVWPKLEDPSVRFGCFGPAPSRGLGDRLIQQLAPDPDGVTAGALFDFDERQEIASFRQLRRATRQRPIDYRRKAPARPLVSSTTARRCQRESRTSVAGT